MDALGIVAQVLVPLGFGFAAGRWQSRRSGASGHTPALLFQLRRNYDLLFDAAFVRLVRARYGCDADAARRVLSRYRDWLQGAGRPGPVQVTSDGELSLPSLRDTLLDLWAREAGIRARAP